MAKGLDVGTMNIICSEKGKSQSISFAQQRNAFLKMEADDLAQNMLDTSKILYTHQKNTINVLGEDAFKFANVFNKPIRRPMKQGIISPDEKESIPMIKLIIERVLDKAVNEGEILSISVPASPVDSNINVLYHSKTVEALAKRLGYNTNLIDEGLAVVYSELGDHNFTGVGISVGAGMTNITVAYLATPIVSFSIARGGDWIDEQVASATGVSIERVTAIKENDFTFNSDYEIGSIQGAIALYYDALVTYIISNLKRKLEEAAPPDAEFPVAIAGGSSRAKGFMDMFEKRISEANLSINISNVKKSQYSTSGTKDPIYAIARGCLIASITREDAEKAEESPEPAKKE